MTEAYTQRITTTTTTTTLPPPPTTTTTTTGNNREQQGTTTTGNKDPAEQGNPWNLAPWESSAMEKSSL
jgi:hypothetical protein